MKQSLLSKTLSLSLLFAMVLSFASCGQTDEIQMIITEQSSKSDMTAEDPDVTTINFAVANYCYVEDKNLKLFNEELKKDGHKYRLQLKQFDDDGENGEYYKVIENELRSGNVDVAYLGGNDGSSEFIGLFNSGALLDLDEIITTEKGKELYEAFPKAWWERVRFNGHTYSIPSPTPVTGGLFAAFNKDYLSDEVIENWDGSLEGIYEIVKNSKWDYDVPRFQYLTSYYLFENMLGCDIQDGLLYDYDTMKIENPLESEKLINYIKLLNQMKNEGLMPKSVSYAGNTAYITEKENLESGKFLVVLSDSEPEDYLLKSNISIKQVPRYLPSQIADSIGISKNTDKLDAVIDFLGILYGEEKYGNLLLYGKQDVDYKLKDGYVADVDGTERERFYNYFTKSCLNLFINTHPVKGEGFVINRKEEYFSYFDSAKVSPFAGFHPISDKRTVISQDFDDFMDSITATNLDEIVKKYKEKLKNDGMDEYLSSARKQWEEYNK
ncbi:MAG: sugar ABC transporter substrate-binding protein [Saccharofermentans sp.]|nr:sugar ABC transporter substrate-binding protein [Saccharofermentans sp.]